MNRKLLLSVSVLAALTATVALAVPMGSPAPDFTLSDVQGRSVKLADFRGKYVVLEWVNPGCPFVQKHYNSGNMPQLQKSQDGKTVAWLTINSTNPSHKDYKTAAQMDAWMKEKGAHPTATLLDPEGTVGHLYGAKTTPHMFIIDPQGTLIYAGAIDDKRTTDRADVKTARNYVQTALAEARAGKPVSNASTTAYGCSIKY